MKDLFDHMEWPEMRTDLKDRIMARVTDPQDGNMGFAPWMLLDTRRARMALAFSLITCLAAGFIMEGTLTQTKQSRANVPMTSTALMYYMGS